MIVFVVGTSAGGTTDAVTTGSIDTTGADLIVVSSSTYSGGAVLTDSKSNTWQSLTLYGTTVQVQLFYVLNPTVGTGHTFTLTAAGKYPGISVAAFSGVDSFDSSSGANAAQPGSISPAGDNEVFVTGLDFYPENTVTINSSFTKVSQQDYVSGTTMGSSIAYKIQTTGGAENPTWSPSASFTDRTSAMAAFVAAEAAILVTPSTASLQLTAYIPLVRNKTLIPRVFGYVFDSQATDTDVFGDVFGALPISTITPTTAELAIAVFAPTVLTPVLATPTTATLSITTFAPTVSTPVAVTPTTVSVSIASFAPVITTPQTLTPTTVALVLTGYAPTVATPVAIIPDTASLVVTGYAPTVATPQTVTPSTAALTTTEYIPSVTTPVLTIPTTEALALNGYVPSVTAPVSLTPDTASLVIAGYAPTAATPVSAIPTTASLTVSGYAPTVITPVPSATLTLTTYIPTVAISDAVELMPNAASLTLASYAPTVSTPQTLTPDTAALALSSYAPGVTTGNELIPGAATLTLTGYAPTVWTPVLLTPTTLALVLTPYSPMVSNPVSVIPTTTSLTIGSFAPSITAGENATSSVYYYLVLVN